MSKSNPRWAMVTGASSGLGIELARSLAARGNNLVLTARRETLMQELAAQLKQQHDVEVLVEPADLGMPDGAATLQHRLEERGIAPDILVNNAGFGLSGNFVDHDPDRLRAMLQLDIVSLTELAHVFGKPMVARGHGHILLVASMASYQPCPGLASYAAAKAYVLSFGEALHVELAPRVSVTVLSPGLMDTGFNAVSGFRPSPAARSTVLLPSEVARIGLDALFAGRPGVIAGRLNWVAAFSNRFTSRHLQAKVALRMSKG